MTGHGQTARVALVTGASSGIGLATALQLGRARYHVIAGVRDPAGAIDLHAAIAREGLAIEVEPLDVTNDDSVAALAARVGEVDVLINNAGVSASAAVEVAPLADARWIFDVNYFGAIRMIQAVMPGMRRRRAGVIVNVSSISAIVSVPALAHYAASKAALEAASETLALEVARFGVRVAIVEPGVTQTPMFTRRRNLRALDPRSPYVEDLSALYGYFTRSLRAPLAAEDVAQAIEHVIATGAPRLRYLLGDAAHEIVEARRASSDEAWVSGAASRAMSGAPSGPPASGEAPGSATAGHDGRAIEATLKELLSDSSPLGVEDIVPSLTIVETGLSSLQLQMFAARVEDAFAIRFGETELGDIETFAHLVDAVTRHCDSKALS